MILSDPVPFAWRGKPALMCVVRNNGHCWGEMRCGADRFSVTTARDQYERTDAEAAEAFIRRTRVATFKPEPSLLVS